MRKIVPTVFCGCLIALANACSTTRVANVAANSATPNARLAEQTATPIPVATPTPVLVTAATPLPAATTGLSAAEALPKAIRAELDKRFAGWKFPQPENSYYRQEIERIGKEEGFDPNVVKGDFDGNGQTDYAIQIECGTEPVNPQLYEGRSEIPKDFLIALMKHGDSYKLHRIEDFAFDYIQLIEKNTTDYDYETGAEFRHRNDGFSGVLLEKSARSFVFERDRFRDFFTSD